MHEESYLFLTYVQILVARFGPPYSCFSANLVAQHSFLVAPSHWATASVEPCLHHHALTNVHYLHFMQNTHMYVYGTLFLVWIVVAMVTIFLVEIF